MIDLHAHILPGVDDGVRTLEEARDLARRSAADGVTAIAATPHVRDDYPTSAVRMERGVAELRADFSAAGVVVQVLHGAEIDLARLAALSADELERLSIAQTGRYVLVEFPYSGWPLSLAAELHRLAHDGRTALIAHPERNAEVQERPERLEGLVEGGALVQVTAASVDGRLGAAPRRAAERLLRLGLVHVLASDAHHPAVREAGLAAAAAAVEDEALARFLTAEAPAAIVAGDALPARPRYARPLFRRRHR